jgi:hypothetical protein
MTDETPPAMPAPTGDAFADSRANHAYEAQLRTFFEKSGARAPGAGLMREAPSTIVQADESRASQAAAAAGGVNADYVAELQRYRESLGARVTPELQRVYEAELAGALAGRQRGESMAAFRARTGTPMSESELANWHRDLAAAKAQPVVDDFRDPYAEVKGGQDWEFNKADPIYRDSATAAAAAGITADQFAELAGAFLAAADRASR